MTAEELQQLLDGAFPGHTVPYVIEEITATTVRMLLSGSACPTADPGGTVSGPTLMALADCAAWMVIIGQIGPVALSVTTSLHIDFLRKPELVDLVADRHPAQAGHATGRGRGGHVLGRERRPGGQGPGHLLDPPSVAGPGRPVGVIAPGQSAVPAS